MRTSVPGNSSRRRRRGYTLIEVLLVILIAGILAGTTLSSVSLRQASSRDEAERLARLIEHAELMAAALGSPIGLELAADQYQFLRWSGTWTPVESGDLSGRRQLPYGIAAESLPDPAAGVAAPRILRFPPTGYPPAFGIRVSGAGHAWHIEGNAAGRIAVTNADPPS